MPAKKTKYLGDLLLQKGLITQKDLDIALKEQKNTNQFLGTALIKLGSIKENELYPVLSDQLGIPYLKLKDIKIDPLVLEKIPARFACHYKIMPIKFEENTLTEKPGFSKIRISIINIGRVYVQKMHSRDCCSVFLFYQICFSF